MRVRSWAILLIVCLLSLLVAPCMAESRIVDIGCGMALNDNGTVWIWGMGSPDNTCGLQPVVMPGVDHVVGTSGAFSPIVLKDDGTVWFLKNYPLFENTSYQLSPDEEPVEISGFSNITELSCRGNFNLLVLRNDGTVWASGSDRYGQLGTGGVYGQDNFLSIDALDAIQVDGLYGIKAVSMGDGHALALKNDGTVWAWGKNDMGQLGDSTTTYTQTLPTQAAGKPTPAMVKGLTDAKAIAAGEEFSMALKEDGTVWTWGDNWHVNSGMGCLKMSKSIAPSRHRFRA